MGLILSLVGIGYVGYVFYMGRLARASQSWPTAAGRIVTAGVEKGHSMSIDGDARANVFSARIRYTFEVAGRSLNGSRICMGGEMDTSSRARAEARCTLYAPGRSVRVHYDPNDPTTCCLETTSEMGPLGYAIGAACTLIGALVSLHIVGPS